MQSADRIRTGCLCLYWNKDKASVATFLGDDYQWKWISHILGITHCPEVHVYTEAVVANAIIAFISQSQLTTLSTGVVVLIILSV